MARTPAQAVAWAIQPRRGYGGLCLKHAREAYGVAARYAYARQAWQATKHRHPQTTLAGVPVGALLWMDSSWSKYGHVAIYTGNGKMATTDSAKATTQHVTVQSWLNAGWRLLGWSEDINGVRVAPTGNPSPPVASGDLYLGVKGSEVGNYQREMNRVFPSYSKLSPDNSYGPRTAAVTREFQRRAGLAVDGVVGPATKAALRKYGVKV